MAWINFLLKALWPYVRTMVLKGQTFKEALKNDKKSLFFALLVMFSFAANAYLVARIVAISREHVILQENYNKVMTGSRQNPVHDGKEVKQNKRPTSASTSASSEVLSPKAAEKEVPSETPVTPPAKKQTPKPRPSGQGQEAAEERYRSLKQKFEEMRNRELRNVETPKTQ